MEKVDREIEEKFQSLHSDITCRSIARIYIALKNMHERWSIID